ncbi:hypothetical protein [Paenibacillus odorifer]|uniref:Uncharacterized protein n=1 Tax=Paenibacillus odorifer TaxID=189426 RepID=A0ABX3GC94_9BACL|nr:hypothetical protein [Paenibacillus odorifer]OMC95948.1 hypothetical protein BSO21_33710 [Paenibacillus odorifer]
MSESGKVSLPTPERIEEIKQTADDSWFAADNSRGAEAHLRGEVFALCEGMNELLAALKESEQQVKDLKEDKRKILAVHDEQCARSSEYYNELIFVKGKSSEAQQTIARQQKKIEWFENNHMGFVDGEAQS